MLNVSFVIHANHPGLPGHFPKQPIAPGVVILDHVVRGLIGQTPDSSLDCLPQVKFIRPLLPDIEVTVTYIARGEGLYKFSCEGNGELIIFGTIQLVQLKA